MTLAINVVVIKIEGKPARMTNEKLHPLVMANVNPDTDIEQARMMVPIFSPIAFWIARVSFPTLAASS